MWVSVYACVRVFALCFIPMAQSHHLRACVSIEFIFGLDMNNKLVIINFVCYTVLSRLNLMWKCGNSRTHISYSHTTRHPHVLTLTLSLCFSISLSQHILWCEMRASVWQSLYIRAVLHCFSIAFMKFQGLVNVILLFCFIWPQLAKQNEKNTSDEKIKKQKTHQLVI